jgi:hypothetical protein
VLTSFLIFLALTGPEVGPGSPTLAVETSRGWREWWRADQAPDRWEAGLDVVADAVRWTRTADGVDLGELRLSGAGEAWRIRVVLVRFDPTRITLRLAHTPDRLQRPGRWSVDAAPPEALFALNVGQFSGKGPWGWLVQEGNELGAPGTGPLAPAVVADSAGRMTFVPADSIALIRARGGVRLAFQSYPGVLLEDGVVPEPLRQAGRGVSLVHRDARLAFGELRDGRWLIGLTRFEGLGGALSLLPFGLTTPEMAAVMGGLGCRRAVLLDGGMSGQLMVREANGRARTWSGLRRVPAGLIGVRGST